jgi:hypothetical protein
MLTSRVSTTRAAGDPSVYPDRMDTVAAVPTVMRHLINHLRGVHFFYFIVAVGIGIEFVY